MFTLTINCLCEKNTKKKEFDLKVDREICTYKVYINIICNELLWNN